MNRRGIQRSPDLCYHLSKGGEITLHEIDGFLLKFEPFAQFDDFSRKTMADLLFFQFFLPLLLQ
jgi:hypothetical protein